MKNCLIWCVVLLAMAGPAFSETKEPPKTLEVDLGGGQKMELVLIPAGSFMMGDKNGEDCENPVHKVNIIKPFYLGKYEVTQEQWETVMGSNPSRFKGAKNPVEKISTQDCAHFLNKLNILNLNRLNTKAGGQGGKFVLPTEAQWEYACRAGSTAAYCFGDDPARLGDYAWYEANSGNKTHPVGEKKANAFGLYDMHGNVSEWCFDAYDPDYYSKSPENDPTGYRSSSHQIYRGGSFLSSIDLEHCRSAYRRWLATGTRSGQNLGLRLCYVVSGNGQLP